MSGKSSRRLAAVWFADIVGYTTLSERDEASALQLVGVLQNRAGEIVSSHSGRVVKFVGDAVLAVFESAGDAVDGALELMETFQAEPLSRDMEATLRIGVHVGEIHTAPDGDIYGDGVNTASRIQGAAGPGQVFLSSFAVESIRHRSGVRADSVGRRRLRGLSRSMELFAVVLAKDGDPGPARQRSRDIHPDRPPRHLGRVIAVGILAGLGALVGFGLFAGPGPFFSGNEEDPRAPEIQGPDPVTADAAVALNLGIEAYYRGAVEEANEALSLFLEPVGTREEQRQGLRYLARNQVMAGDPQAAAEALQRLLTLEPPLALLLPSLEDSTLISLYLDARREKIRSQGRFESTQPVRELMLFDFQVFIRDLEIPSMEGEPGPGYVVALMLETELDMAGIPVTSIKEMSFRDRGDQAYVDLETTLASMNQNAPSHLLTGSVAINQTGALLSAWVYELETGHLVLSEQVSGSQEDLLLTLPEALATRIQEQLQTRRPEP